MLSFGINSDRSSGDLFLPLANYLRHSLVVALKLAIFIAYKGIFVTFSPILLCASEIWRNRGGGWIF